MTALSDEHAAISDVVAPPEYKDRLLRHGKEIALSTKAELGSNLKQA
ncbi:hypothetical protein NOR53_1756 [gamma proteobacterium NOR5-3]|nr:hypothetical protein NOR53_1756 [gamma proteobacterium NOR5-3]